MYPARWSPHGPWRRAAFHPTRCPQASQAHPHGLTCLQHCMRLPRSRPPPQSRGTWVWKHLQLRDRPPKCPAPCSEDRRCWMSPPLVLVKLSWWCSACGDVIGKHPLANSLITGSSRGHCGWIRAWSKDRHSAPCPRGRLRDLLCTYALLTFALMHLVSRQTLVGHLSRTKCWK